MSSGIHFDCIPYYIGYLIQLVFVFAAGSFLIGIILGGYKYAIGSVTTEGKEAGKKQLTGAVMGFVVVVLSYLLVDTVLEALL
jgi:ABC-type spermidine/putrescine transport system permease subunit I